MKLVGEAQVFKNNEGENKNYLTLQVLEKQMQFQVSCDKSVAQSLEPGDRVRVDADVFIGEFQGKMFISVQDTGLKKVKAAS